MEFFCIQLNRLPDVSLRFEPNLFCRRLFIFRPFQLQTTGISTRFDLFCARPCSATRYSAKFRKIPVVNPYLTQRHEVTVLQ